MGFSPANLLFFLWAASATVSGVVVDEAGQPVVDAEVRLSPNPAYLAPVWEGDAGTIRVRTSAEGTFRLERVASGRIFDLAVTRPGFAPSLRAVVVPERRPLSPLRVTLRRGRTVSGRIVDGAGRPAVEAQVELTQSWVVAGKDSGVVPSDRGLHRATTGPDGRFTIPDLPAGRFDLDALGPGFRLRLAEAVAVTPGAEPLQLGTFVLERGAPEGRVLDSQGRPVAEAKVWVRPEGWEEEWWSTDFSAEEPAAVTGPDGRFEIPGLPARGWNGLVVCRKGFAAAVAESPDFREPVEIVLSPAVLLSGRVEGSRGEPVAGALVSSWTSGVPRYPQAAPEGPCPPAPASSDAFGRFTLELANPGWYDVEAEAGGFLRARREQVGAPSGEDLVLTLEPGVTVQGRVLDPEGEPISRAVVWVHDGTGGGVSVSGPDGSYHLSDVEPGPRSLKAQHGDYSEERLDVEVPAEGKRLDIVLKRQPSYEIRGRVVGPDGEPVEGAQVRTAAGLWTATETDGSFLLRTTESDDPWLRAEKEGYGAGQIELPPPPVSGLEIRLTRSASLTGQLLGLAPEDLAQAAVSVLLGEGLSQRLGIVDSEGRYRVLDLAPGEWMVNAQAGHLSTFESVTVPPDVPEAVHDLVFPPTFEVRGRVKSPDGEPLPGAEVFFDRASPGMPVTRKAESDGTFLVRLEEGEYEATASLPGYFGGEVPRTVPVAGSPVDGVDFQLTRGAVLTGRLFEFEPGEEVFVAATHTAGTVLYASVDPQGIYRIQGMSPGTWELRVISGPYLHPQGLGEGQVILLPGETEAVLDIVLHGFSPFAPDSGIPEEP